MQSNRRLAAAISIGLIVGCLVALATGSVLDHQLLGGPWGTIYGTLAFLVSSGVAVMLAGQFRRSGNFLVALGAGGLSVGAWAYIAFFGVPPLTASGYWLWPLALAATTLALLAAVGTRRRR